MNVEVKIKEVMSYNGHSVSNRGIVKLSLKAAYSELSNSVQALQMLNEDVNVQIKMHDEKPFALGSFMIDNFNVNSAGEQVVKLRSVSSLVEIDRLNDLIPLDSDDNVFGVMMKASIDVEESEGEK